MALINKQKAIDEIRGFQSQITCSFSEMWLNGMNEGFDHAVGVIEIMDTVESPQWIPVSERMPEDSYETDLIVTTGSGMVKLAWFTKENGFVSLTGFHRISEVTAWMKLELPKPYERKEDDKID